MIVKGIIKSIDYSGNTCTVRIPIFESAANENEVVISAILSTLPGIYNGYKEEDVVFIAFENNDYDMPVVIGKLYLGVENEKNDPRGAIVCNNITAAQPISIPISSKLTLDNDPQHSSVIGVDKGIDSYKSIADLAKNLQKQDEKIGSLSVKVIDDGENLGAEIAKKVSITDEATKQRGLGWNLNTEKWEVYAKDSVGDSNKIDKFPIMTIDRTGMVISGNLVLTGYPQTTEIKYTNSTDKNTPPTGDDVKWQDSTKDLYTDEHYIWKRTREVFYAYDAETDKWELTKYGDAHYECITGAKGDPGKDGSNGTPATTYWAKLSTAVHTGKNQKSDIEITPYVKTGNSQEAVDTTAYFNYSLDNGAKWKYNDDWMSVTTLQGNKIVILAKDIIADNIIIKLAHAYTDPNDSTKLIYNEYETETITYSPLNTPIIDLTNDTDVIKYKPDGTNITGSVTSTAQVYLGGSPEVASYSWSCSPENGANFTVTEEEPQKITVNNISSDKAILTCTATTTNFKDKNGKGVKISKDFVVSKEVVVASYWLSFSPVHTGNLQQTDIEVKALAKIGNDSESKDTNAYFRYSWDNGTTWIHKDWTKPTDATLIIKKADIQNNNLRIQATHDSNGDKRQVYEDETITYSPLNTPVLDLTNDNDAIAYDGNTILGNSVSSTAAVYLNGAAVNGCTFAWTATNCTISGANTATVTVSAIDDGESEGTVTCKVTGIPNYPNTELVKVFTVAKQYKGNHGADGPTPKSSTTYYIYSATTPDPDDPKWEIDPANLDKPNGGYFCWTKTVTTYSDGKTIIDGPNKDAAFALAQGKSTNYYSPTEPGNNIKEGDCWFDTGYVKIDPNPDKKTGYLGKFVLHSDQDQNIVVDDKDKIYVQGIEPDTSGTFTRFIPSESTTSQLYMVKITPKNIDKINIKVGTTAAYETGNLKQWDGYKWKDIAGELVTNKLTANYINALDITTKKITVLQDAAAAIEEQKILFEADGTNATGKGKVKIADFDVNHESLHSFSNKNGYELNIKSANDVELDEQITINDAYMQTYNINTDIDTDTDISTTPQLAWDEMRRWPTDGQASNNELPINDTSITNNYTLLQLNTPGTTNSDTNPDRNLWLKARGYISFFRIDILQDILDFNIWIGIINSTSKLNRSDYLSSQDTVRLFSSTTKFTTWAALNEELKNFKSGSASALSELGYCRPAIGDETSKMPTSGSLTDNMVKFSWGNLSANTYLYCIVENNYPRDYVISRSEGQGQTNTWTDTYGNIHTTIIPGGADAENVPGYLRAFLILDKTFTKYGAAISAGYNGEDFILTGDGKVIASNILITGGSINADSGNMGPLEISDGEINTAGLMINKSSTHIKNGASLKILGKSGNTTKPIAKISKNGFIISPQGMQAENNKYFSYKIGEVNGANDAKNTPGLLWKQRSDIQYDTVYVKATLNKDDKKITFNLYSKYSEDGLKTEYETSSIPTNKTLDVVVYLKYAVKRLQKRKISKKIDLNGNGVLTDFISLPEKTIITVSPIQFKFKKNDPNLKEISFTNLGAIGTIYGISNTKGGALADELIFTTLAPTEGNVIDPNLYVTSSILPASTFTSELTNESNVTEITETKNEYDLGSSTYPWNNVYSKYFYGVSDRREKTDITPLSEQNNLDEFYNKLKPVSFSFKSSNDTLHFGLIAQDVDEASAGLPTDKPLAIVNKSDPNCLSIDYQELIAVNILKIQQLSKKIDSLEAEIKCLKGEDK